MTLEQFLIENNDQFSIVVRNGYKGKIAILDSHTARNRAQIWYLDDYIVTSVSKGVIWLGKKE